MSNLCIIPARGGSKRIPRKNIKNFNGKPIISYSIACALQSGLFEEVMVSTDDDEIAEIANKYGAKTPFLRSKKNADDFATTTDVIEEVLAFYAKRSQKYQYICCFYATAPLTTVEHLTDGFELLRSENLDSVFPVAEFNQPIWRSLKRENNRTVMNWPEYLRSRSQDLPKAYHDAGQWYWLDISKFKGQLWTSNTDTIVLPSSQVQDIDNEEDWGQAEIKYNRLF